MDNSSTAGAGASILFFLFQFVFILGGYALGAWLMSTVFAKMGIEKWKAWVPFYNIYLFLQAGGFSGWLLFIAFVPFFGGIALAVILTIAAHRIGKDFGKDGIWTVLYFFLSPVWCGILGLGSAQYRGNNGMGGHSGGYNNNPYAPTNGGGYTVPRSTGGYGPTPTPYAPSVTPQPTTEQPNYGTQSSYQNPAQAGFGTSSTPFPPLPPRLGKDEDNKDKL
jgi:hypothetical protein